MRGFSLAHLLIIIGTIATAVVLFFVIYKPLDKFYIANDEKRTSDLKAIQSAVEKYYADFRKYPPNPGDCKKNIDMCRLTRLDASIANWGEGFNPYLEKLPKDPEGDNYAYYVSSDRQSYYIYASLDIDKQNMCNDTRVCQSIINNGLNPKMCKNICNYAVTSGNVTP